jgi:hypothetical protein
MLTKIKGSKGLKLVVQGSPLVAIALGTILDKPPLGLNFLMLMIFLWIQVFFISEYFFTPS